jgi:chitinase
MAARRAVVVFVATLVFLLAVGQSAVAAPRKPPKPSPTPTPAPMTNPTPPTDLRITALTSYSVSLSWTAATSSVGIQAYLLTAGNNYERAPGDATARVSGPTTHTRSTSARSTTTTGIL